MRLQFEAVSRMPPREKQIILDLIESMIVKYEAQR
jgi:hypothetical protein